MSTRVMLFKKYIYIYHNIIIFADGFYFKLLVKKKKKVHESVQVVYQKKKNCHTLETMHMKQKHLWIFISVTQSVASC